MKNTNSKSTKKSSTTTKKSRAAKKASAKQAAAVRRNFLDPQLKIVKKVTGNPRREGSFGYDSFALIKNGITVEQFVEKGGRLRDLHWDIEHNNVEVKKSA